MRSSNPKLWEALLVVVFRLCEPGIVEKSRAVFMHFQHANECAKCCLNYSVWFLSQQLPCSPWHNQISAWRADLLNTLLSTTRPAHSTPQKPSGGVDGELFPQRPVGSLISLSQRPWFLTFFNRLWIAIHSTASGRERTVEGALQSSSLPRSHAWLSSLPNKGLSSFSFQSGGASKGYIGLGWGWTGNLQKIENKNDLCKFSSGKPAFLVACIYNIKGEITNKAVNELVWIRSLFFGSPCLESSVQPSHWLAASIW